MEQGLFKFETVSKQIKYFKEEKVIIWFATIFFLTIFSITIAFFVSYWFVLVKHLNIGILNLFVDLWVKSLCFKKPYNSRMLLLFIIIGWILLE
jgi:dolichol kinase